jgi:transposase
MERSNFSSTHLEGEIMAIVTVGIDLAKNVFAVHGVDETGKPALVRSEVPRAKLLELIANLPPCIIGMEIAAKNARMCWAMLQRGEAFKLPA